MRTLHNYMEAAKQRREDGEAGFSLIELIVVVAILGILVAIAIPVFGSIQQSAKNNALHTVAANAATQVAAQVVAGDTISTANLAKDGVTLSVAPATITAATVDSICVTANAGAGSMDGATQQKAGPGC